MQVLESDVERACKRWADRVGAELFKLQGTKGWPDRILLYKGQVVFLEFKRPGTPEHNAGHTSPLQEYYIDQLRDKGYLVLCLTSLKAFKSLLGDLTHTKFAVLIGSQRELQERYSSLQD